MDTDTLTLQIERGLLDNELAAIEAALTARLTVTRSTRKATDFCVGDKVKINSYCGTQYIRNATASVIGKSRTKIVIKLDRPVGRFIRTVNGVVESSDISVPPSILDKI